MFVYLTNNSIDPVSNQLLNQLQLLLLLLLLILSQKSLRTATWAKEPPRLV